MMARLAKLHQYRVVSYLRDLGMNSGKCDTFKTSDFIYGPSNYRGKVYVGDTAIFKQCEDHQIQDDFKYVNTVVFDKCNKEFMSKNYNTFIFPNVKNIILANHLNQSSDIYNFTGEINIFIELPIFFHIVTETHPNSKLTDFNNIHYVSSTDIYDYMNTTAARGPIGL